MLNKKISQLPLSLTLGKPDILPVVIGGFTKRILGTTLKQFVLGESVDAGGMSFVGDLSSTQFINFNFLNNVNQPYEVMRITSAGNVGIGTQTPGAKLHVLGGANTALLESASQETALDFKNTGTNGRQWRLGTGSTSGGYANGGFGLYDVTAGAMRMLFDASGNVGIGTITPDAPLVLQANNDAFSLVVRGRSSDNNGLILFKNFLNSESLGKIQHTGNDFLFANLKSGASLFYTSNTERMRIDASGNVGIGTSTPGYLLDIRSAANTTFHIQGNTSGVRLGASADTPVSNCGYFGTYSSHATVFGTNNAERMRIDANGNVGIGTLTPGVKLDVAGIIQAYDPVNATQLICSTNTSQASIQLVRNQAGVDRKKWEIAHYNDLAGGAFTIRTVNDAYTAAQDAILIGRMPTGFGVSDIVLGTQGNERFRVNSVGDVGIGTSAPGAKLHVLGSSNTMLLESAATETALDFKNTGTNGRQWRIATGGSSGGFANGLFGIYDFTAAAVRLVINPSGNVGIGTASPFSKLEVDGDIGLQYNNYIGSNIYWNGSQWRYKANGIGGILKLTDVDANGIVMNTFSANTSGANAVATPLEVFRASPNGNVSFLGGNVGIGTSTPSVKLDVAGHAQIFANNPVTDLGTLTVIKPTSAYATNDIFVYTYANQPNGYNPYQGTIGGGLRIRTAGGTYTTPTATLSGRVGYVVAASTHNGVDWKNSSIINLGIESNATIDNHNSYIAFETLSGGYLSTRQEQMRITSAGNVGIGTVTPTSKLDVAGVVQAFSESSPIQLICRSNTVQTGIQFKKTDGLQDRKTWEIVNMRDVYGAPLSIRIVNDAYTGSQEAITIQRVLSGFGVGDIIFSNQGLERMRIIADGNVGIGTSTPDSKLHVVGNTKIVGNLTVFGDLSSTGTQTFANTVFTTTSALSVINLGAGPALYVGNLGTGDIASFYDLDQGIEVLHIGGVNGSFPNVGVKTSSPTKDFTVNGEISSNNIIWDRAGNSNQWNSVYSTVNSTSGAQNFPSSGGTLTGGLTGTTATFNSVSATKFYGDGSSLTGIIAGGDTTKVLPLSGGTMTGGLTGTTATFNSVSATKFYGDGSSLTGISIGQLGIVTGSVATELTGNGSSVVFGINGYVSSDKGGYLVSVGGLDQPASYWSVSNTNGGEITFVDAPKNGEIISVRSFASTSGGSINGTAYMPLSGGTMTGGLTGTSARFASVSATKFYGDGSSLTGVTSANAVSIQGRNISPTAPTAGQYLAWNATTSKWEPQGGGGSVTFNTVGTHMWTVPPHVRYALVEATAGEGEFGTSGTNGSAGEIGQNGYHDAETNQYFAPTTGANGADGLDGVDGATGKSLTVSALSISLAGGAGGAKGLKGFGGGGSGGGGGIGQMGANGAAGSGEGGGGGGLANGTGGASGGGLAGAGGDQNNGYGGNGGLGDDAYGGAGGNSGAPAFNDATGGGGGGGGYGRAGGGGGAGGSGYVSSPGLAGTPGQGGNGSSGQPPSPCETFNGAKNFAAYAGGQIAIVISEGAGTASITITY